MAELNQVQTPTPAERIAPVCHAANKAYCESHGDYSQESWPLAPSWQRDSTINGVQFKIDNPKSTPENQHESWLKAREKGGWVYGKVKDTTVQTHPCMVPYHALPEHQKKKDALFQAIVTALL